MCCSPANIFFFFFSFLFPGRTFLRVTSPLLRLCPRCCASSETSCSSTSKRCSVPGSAGHGSPRLCLRHSCLSLASAVAPSSAFPSLGGEPTGHREHSLHVQPKSPCLPLPKPQPAEMKRGEAPCSPPAAPMPGVGLSCTTVNKFLINSLVNCWAKGLSS